jgi:hypothetical protein
MTDIKTEEDLTTNDGHSIVRIGDTVHRPTSWWTPAVHELLNYLESVGFEYSPRVLGFDEQGREILTYMEGESGGAGWYKIHSDEGLQNYARFLRDYHKAVADYKPSADSIWAYAEGGVKPGEIICHGDFSPWNLTWDGEKPIGIIDWDLVFPAKPSYDVLYALEWSAPFRDDKAALESHHFAEVPDRKRRIDIFLEAYGTNRRELGDVVTEVAAMQRTCSGFEKLLAERGMQPQVDWVANGDLEVNEKHALWTEANRNLFE